MAITVEGSSMIGPYLRITGDERTEESDLLSNLRWSTDKPPAPDVLIKQRLLGDQPASLIFVGPQSDPRVSAPIDPYPVQHTVSIAPGLQAEIYHVQDDESADGTLWRHASQTLSNTNRNGEVLGVSGSVDMENGRIIRSSEDATAINSIGTHASAVIERFPNVSRAAIALVFARGVNDTDDEILQTQTTVTWEPPATIAVINQVTRHRVGQGGEPQQLIARLSQGLALSVAEDGTSATITRQALVSQRILRKMFTQVRRTDTTICPDGRTDAVDAELTAVYGHRKIPQRFHDRLPAVPMNDLRIEQITSQLPSFRVTHPPLMSWGRNGATVVTLDLARAEHQLGIDVVSTRDSLRMFTSTGMVNFEVTAGNEDPDLPTNGSKIQGSLKR